MNSFQAKICDRYFYSPSLSVRHLKTKLHAQDSNRNKYILDLNPITLNPNSVFLYFFFFFGHPTVYEFLGQGSDLSHSCNLSQILNPLYRARGRTCNPALPRCHQSHFATSGTLLTITEATRASPKGRSMSIQGTVYPNA